MQQWPGYSDPAMKETSLQDVPILRDFAGLHAGEGHA